MDVVAAHAETGCRLADVIKETDLGKATAHRFLRALEGLGLIELDATTGTYFIGLRVVSLAAAAKDRFSLVQKVHPHLERLARLTSDTVYLSLRIGHEAVCVDRTEGDFPIKALTLDVGGRRPLGISAASLALLAFLPDEQINQELDLAAEAIEAFGIGMDDMRRMVKNSRELGYALNDGRIVHGVVAIAMPIRNNAGIPIASIAVAAIRPRMLQERQKLIAGWMDSEIKAIEKNISPLIGRNYESARKYLGIR